MRIVREELIPRDAERERRGFRRRGRYLNAAELRR